jgi:hypothetical protein
MIARVKHYKFPKPDFSDVEFYEWSKTKTNYPELHQKWVEKNFNKNYSPSLDRIDPLKPYMKGNLQWVTWRENNLKGLIDDKQTHVEAGTYGRSYEEYGDLSF